MVRESGPAVRQLAGELRKLRAAAGDRPSLRALSAQAERRTPPMKLAVSTISNWVNGIHVPRTFDELLFVAQRYAAQTGEAVSEKEWERWYTAAQQERRHSTNRSRGGVATAHREHLHLHQHEHPPPTPGIANATASNAQDIWPAEACAPIPDDVAANGLANVPRFDLFVGRSREVGGT
ncbi:hypothetical protein ACU686_12240 [Yinghuangia aomiensis]